MLAAFVLASNVTKSSNSSGQAGASSSGVYPISYSWLSGSAEGKRNRITERKPAPPNDGQLWETRQQKDKNFLLHPLVPSVFGKEPCLQAPHLQEGEGNLGGCSWQRSYEALCCSHGASAWIRPHPAMVSVSFPGFFPMSVSCIPFFFSSQKALILLWAGNTLVLCVTANYHGNSREGRRHRSCCHLLLLP